MLYNILKGGENMRIILSQELIHSLFDDSEDNITVNDLLKHPFIKSKLDDSDIVGVFKEQNDANIIDSWVLDLKPKDGVANE